MTRITLPTCRAPYPGGSRRVPVSIASPLTRPSPFPRRVGIRIFTFEACSGFTRVTARWIAQPPKAAFVTRLQPSQLPDQTARQLPEQSTTLRVEPSSTGDTRRRDRQIVLAHMLQEGVLECLRMCCIHERSPWTSSHPMANSPALCP